MAKYCVMHVMRPNMMCMNVVVARKYSGHRNLARHVHRCGKNARSRLMCVCVCGCHWTNVPLVTNTFSHTRPLTSQCYYAQRQQQPQQHVCNACVFVCALCCAAYACNLQKVSPTNNKNKPYKTVSHHRSEMKHTLNIVQMLSCLGVFAVCRSRCCCCCSYCKLF